MAKERYYYDVQPLSSLRELIELAKNESGDTVAYKFKNADKEICDVTYAQFYEDVYALGTALADMGISKTHIACIAENSYKWINTYLMTLCSDCVFVGIDRELPEKDYLHVITDSDSEVVFYYQKLEDSLRANREALSKVKYFIGIDRTEDDGEFLSFDLLREKGRALYKNGNTSYVDMKNDFEAMKMLVYTSGTTGFSKGVMLSEKNLISLIYFGLRSATIYDRCLSILPYHHTYEAVCGILVGIHKRVTLCINESLRAVAKNLAIYKPNYMYVVPAVASALHKNVLRTAQKQGKLKVLLLMMKVSNALRKVGIDLRRKLFASVHEGLGGNLLEVVCGGAPIPVDTAYFFDAIGIMILNVYGITECSPLVSVNSPKDSDYKTVGYPLECVEIKIDEPDSDGIGEICVKGDIVMLGYYKKPEQTAEVFKDGWFSTGDFGYVNKKGQLVITGRKKNIIVLDNGKNIYPEEIEEYIYTIPYVKEVVVYDSTDADKLILCAEIYPDNELLGDNDVNADICRVLSELPPYKQIGKIVMRDEEFVKNSSRKIKRGEIVKQ
ncbi:MAG: AMP-binding protein [Clostridia bacterium]|nr:AMP-binding protein [Clostridia bacterium]